MGGGTSRSSRIGRAQGLEQAELGRQQEARVTPIRNELLDQILEALRTGGVQARLPIAQQAVEQSRQATSSALQQTREGLFRSGLQGTPFGEQILAQQTLAGEQQARLIPVQIAEQLMQLAPSATQAFAGSAAQLFGQGTQGVLGAGALQAQERGQQQALIASIIGAILGSASGGFGGGGGGGGGGGRKGAAFSSVGSGAGRSILSGSGGGNIGAGSSFGNTGAGAF